MLQENGRDCMIPPTHHYLLVKVNILSSRLLIQSFSTQLVILHPRTVFQPLTEISLSHVLCFSFAHQNHPEHSVSGWQVHFCWLDRAEVCEISLHLSDKLYEKKMRDFVPVLWHQFGPKQEHFIEG